MYKKCWTTFELCQILMLLKLTVHKTGIQRIILRCVKCQKSIYKITTDTFSNINFGLSINTQSTR